MRGLFLVVLAIAHGGCSIAGAPPSQSANASRNQLAGTIIFGSVDNPEATFNLDEEVAWSAFLAQPVEGTKVHIVVTESGDEVELFGYEQFITDPEATTLVNLMPLGRFLPQSGAYVMRYITTDGDVVAEGEFELVGQRSPTAGTAG